MGVTHVYKRCFNRIFNRLVSSFQGAIGSLVVGRGEGDLDSKGGHDVPVEVGYKRVAVVRDGQAGTAVPARPLEKGPTAFS